MRTLLRLVLLLVALTLPHGMRATPQNTAALLCRVVDVGSGLCCVVRMPGDRYLIYDTGHWAGGGAPTFAKIREIVPDGAEIDLLVLSHSDSDHLAATDEVCAAYRVRRVLRAGYERETATWRDATAAVLLEAETDDCIDVNLAHVELAPGSTYRYGDTLVTVVYGLHRPPAEWGLSGAEERNAGSIVIRIYYAGRSILLCGDTVGRHIGDPTDVCIAAERAMVDNAAVIDLDSDVIVAPHHGADNGSSTLFIEAVDPEFVLLSAGHAHRHPRAAAVQRYLDHGVPIANILRTDLGDDEGNDEWDHGRVAGQSDGTGDDDIDVWIHADGTLEVGYREEI